MHYTWTSKFKVGERRKLQSFLWFIYKTKHSSSLKIVFLCWWWRLMVVVLVLWCHQLNEIHYTLSYFLLNSSCKRRNSWIRHLILFLSLNNLHVCTCVHESRLKDYLVWKTLLFHDNTADISFTCCKHWHFTINPCKTD